MFNRYQNKQAHSEATKATEQPELQDEATLTARQTDGTLLQWPVKLTVTEADPVSKAFVFVGRSTGQPTELNG